MTKFPSDKELERVRKKLDNSIASKLLPKNANKVDTLKYKLCEKFVIYKNENKITQRVLAQRIGIDESLVSKITHYHFEEFTVDRLMNCLAKIYPEFVLEVSVA